MSNIKELIKQAYLDIAAEIEAGELDMVAYASQVSSCGPKAPLVTMPSLLTCETCAFRSEDGDHSCGRMEKYPVLKDNESLNGQFMTASPLMCWTPHDEAIEELGEDMPAVFQHPERRWWGDMILLAYHYGKIHQQMGTTMPVVLSVEAQPDGRVWASFETGE